MRDEAAVPQDGSPIALLGLSDGFLKQRQS